MEKQFTLEETSFLIFNLTQATLGFSPSPLRKLSRRIIERLSFNVEPLLPDQLLFIHGIMEHAAKNLTDEEKANPEKKFYLVESILKKTSGAKNEFLNSNARDSE